MFGAEFVGVIDVIQFVGNENNKVCPKSSYHPLLFSDDAILGPYWKN